ncbi:MAG TPA: hypothetical protein PKX27_12950 [Bacteroidales bacterium]|jgi:hypothetical protein|nr:hypothetical protein [Bacteroidales bacterium]HOX75850.1 hypothetical protein [Bacteroidales bacterium]HPM88889.1 hypothetical protein [Bacteroidales bacterium]
MKKFLIWLLAFIITVFAAYYQRKTGPTYPKRVTITLNGINKEIKLVRSIGHDERSEVKLGIADTSIKATLFYKRFKTDDEYSQVPFVYREYPVNSFVMNRIFKMTEEKGLFADIPQQPEAGKLQYYIDITDNAGTRSVLKEQPVVVRYKGAVPSAILLPHILIMFIAMLFSTAAGLAAAFRLPVYKKYGIWTLILLTAGGMILGPVVQKYAFGALWTGIPFGWDLTDNKTLIAFVFWIMAVVINIKKDKPLATLLAAFILLLVYSIPHSLLGSELDYSSNQVIQGTIIFFIQIQKIHKLSAALK